MFYSSIGLFLIMSTVIVLFALGYGYDFSKNEILKTGGFGVTVNIGAEVYVNDELSGTTSFLSDSYSESRFLPGAYSVSVEADGYRSWQKSVVIEEGAFTDFPTVVLLPEALTAEQLTAKNLPVNIKNIYWYKGIFYFQSGDQIISYELETTKKEVLVKTVEAFIADGDTLIYRATDKDIYTFALDDNKKEPLKLPVELEGIQKYITVGGVGYAINKTDTQSTLNRIEDGQVEKLADNVSDMKLSYDGGKLLYYNGHEVFILYLSNTSTQPYKISGQTDLLTRTSRSITDVQWYKDSNHVLINGSGILSFTELDNRGGRNNYDLINSVRSFFYDRNNDLLYTYSASGLSTTDLP